MTIKEKLESAFRNSKNEISLKKGVLLKVTWQSRFFSDEAYNDYALVMNSRLGLLKVYLLQRKVIYEIELEHLRPDIQFERL
jgi:hypothetical protein